MTLNEPALPIWTREYEVHAYDVDFKKEASLEAVCRWLQEAAWQHAEALGVGFSQLNEQGRLWVLSRFALEVRSCPRWGNGVVIATWPRAAKSVFAMREFELRDASGSVLVAATSAWLVLDACTRKPVRAEKLLSSIPSLTDRRALPQDPEKLPEFCFARSGVPGPVQYGDLDVNGHVNAARYVAWLLNAYPVEFHRTHTVVSVQINYLDETLAGDSVVVSSHETGPGEFMHSVTKGSQTAEVCRARMRWEALSK